MTPRTFDILLDNIEVAIYKEDTKFRKAISPRKRLMSTLRFLCSGANLQVISEVPRIAPSTLSHIIPEVCEAIWKIMGPQYITLPTTQEEWKEKALQFQAKWDYPRSCGALDGKHVKIKCPGRSGSTCFNYKQYFSLVLFALADANHNFLFVDIGAQGASNDSGIYNRSKLHQMLQNGELNLPETHGDVDGLDCPYHFLGDDAFAQSSTLFKPYPAESRERYKMAYNYRQSRARRIVESAFGILSHRFGVIFGPICQDWDNAILTVKACTVLHNFLNVHEGINSREQAVQEAADEAEAPADMAHVPQNPGDGSEPKRRLGQYFLTEKGSISKFDQNERIFRTSRREPSAAATNDDGSERIFRTSRREPSPSSTNDDGNL